MAKISLETILSGFNLQKINSNFDKVEAALNNQVLYRDNPLGEPNALLTNLDANGRAIYNLPAPSVASQAARLQDVQNAIGNQAVANLTGFTPAGGLLSTNVQGAIEEIVNRGASLFTWAQAYTGAKVRNFLDRFRDEVYITDFVGADPTGVSDSTAAAQAATNTGKKVKFPAGTYRITNVTYTGRIDWEAEGQVTLLSDTNIVSIQNGTGSRFIGFNLMNITAPWIIYRDPANWTAVPTVVQSNGDGWQPTVNDGDIYGSLTPEQRNQNIGPTIYFYGNATDIEVARITGRFVNIAMYDTRYSSVHDCNIRGGKLDGTITFWNINAQSGLGNKAYNNTINFPSNSGIMYAANIGAKTFGNTINNCGESGIKYYQNTAGGVSARCFSMACYDNEVNYHYYDGFDLQADYPSTTINDTRHRTYNNRAFGGFGTGFYCDGQNNLFQNNVARSTGNTSFMLTMANSLISGNYAYSCNTRGLPGTHQMSVLGDGNHLLNNYIFRGTGTGSAIYSPFAGLAYNNYAYDGTFFWGNPGSITKGLSNNYDNSSDNVRVLNTLPQAIRQNSSSISGLKLHSENEGWSYVDMTFHPRSHVLTNPSATIRGQAALGIPGSEVGSLTLAVAQGGNQYAGLTVMADSGIPGKAWTALATPNIPVIPSLLPTGFTTFWVDQVNNRLSISVKYTDGTTKTANIPLV